MTGPHAIVGALAILILHAATASAQDRQPVLDTNPPYVQVVVTVCPVIEVPLEPINQGKTYENERSMLRQERSAYFRAIGCIDVPIPPERILQELTYRQCMGHAGYLASMQYLEQNKTLSRTPVIGQWVCIPGRNEFGGVVYQ